MNANQPCDAGRLARVLISRLGPDEAGREAEGGLQGKPRFSGQVTEDRRRAAEDKPQRHEDTEIDLSVSVPRC